jgi:multidrug efflux pump subunit AcrB
VEETNHFFHQIDATIREVIPPAEIETILDNIGIPNSGINLSSSGTSTVGELDGDILIALKHEHTPVQETTQKLREKLAERFPQATFFFTPADITTQILDFGLPAPIDIQVVGNDPKNYGIAQQIAKEVRTVPGAADVHVHQINNVPELDVNVDRDLAQSVGLTERDVAGNVLASLVGTGQVTPSFYLDPKNGVSYLVDVQSPQRDVNSMSDLLNTPVLPSQGVNQSGGMGAAQQEQLLSNLTTITRSVSPQIVDHYNVQTTYDVLASASGRDLGGVSSDIDKILAKYKKTLPKGSTMIMRGQVQSMRSSFTGLGFGLIFAIVLVYLLMVVNFQSWVDPLIMITGLPGALSGILWMLFVTQTTLNVPSLMGSIMCIGVATSNSILLITFANDRRAEGDNAIQAAIAAGFTRLRPVLMTALALILGMLPMALGLGEGGEQNAPLGRAVIGGSTVATITTLFFVPLIYTVLRRKQAVQADDDKEIDKYVADEDDLRMARMRASQQAGENDGATA